MVAIPFPASTNPGQAPSEGTGRLINVYAEQKGDQALVFHRAPGVSVLGSQETAGTWTHWSFPFEMFFSETEQFNADGIYLGGVVVEQNLYARFGTKFYLVTADGAFAQLTGTATGSDKTHFARNNNATPQVVFVCDDGMFYFNGTAKAAFADGDLPLSQCVCFHDGYFMFGTSDGKLYATNVNSMDVNALDFTTCESNPDGVTRVWSFKGLLYAAGPATIEVYGPPVNAEAFPLTRQGYNITPGLITPFAVAGYEAEFGNFPIYVGSDCTVRLLNGSTPQKISPPDLDFLIASEPDKSVIEALCYISRGNAFWQVSGTDWTWVFNLNNMAWHERESYGLDRSRMTLSIPFASRWLTGDTQGYWFLEVDPDVLVEVDSPLIATLESAPVKEFPNRIRVPRADFDFTVGVGDVTGEDPIETDPQVMISWSDDGGRTWSDPRQKDLGEQAEWKRRVSVFLTGATGTHGRRWRLQVSDPVHFGLLGGDMSAELRNK